MAPKRRLRSNTSHSIDPSSDDDTSTFQMVQRPTLTKSPVAPAPADQESDGSDGDDERGAGDEIYSSDEIGENGAVIKRQPPPKRMAVVKIPMKNAASPESSPLKRRTAKSPPRKKKVGQAAASASPPPKTRNAAAAQLTGPPSQEKAATAVASDAAKSPPRKKAAASEAAKSPRPKKAAASTEVMGTPPPNGPADKTKNVAPLPEAAAPAGEDTPPQLQKGEYEAEKHFKEKSQTYWYLWQMVLTLEAEHFLSFKGAFLKIDDTKANILNAEIKKLYVQEMKQQLWWKNTEKDVTKMLIDLIE